MPTPAGEPQDLGPWRLLGPLGRGGMGVVWRAEARDSGLPVAIKTLLRADPRAVDRFRAEIRALAMAEHPHVLEAVDVGVASEPVAGLEAGQPWIALELASGGSMARRCGAMGFAEVRDVLRAVLDALGWAHAAGLVHRDVKPENVLVCTAADLRPGVKLADFGLAVFSASARDRRAGTRAYMAPEQAAGQALGPWTDVYAVGRTAVALLGGDVSRWHEALERAPSGFEGWLARCCAPDPDARWAFAADAAEALDRLETGSWAPPPEVLPAAGPSTTWSSTLDGAPEAPAPAPPEAVGLPLSPAPFPAVWRPAATDADPLAELAFGIGLLGLRPPADVGREAAIDRVGEALRDVHAGGPARWIVVTGAPGSGAAWVVDACARRASATGAARVVRVRDRSDALRVAFEEALGLGASGRAVALARRLPGLPPDDRELLLRWLDGDAAFESAGHRAAALARALGAMAHDRPVLVCVEAIDRQPEAAAVLAAGADRVMGLGSAEGGAFPGAGIVALAPLSPDEARRAVRRTLRVVPEVEAELAERSGGSPEAIVAWLAAWAAEGRLVPGPGGFRLTGPAPAPGALLAAASAWLDARLARRPASVRTLSLAAAGGAEVEVAALGRAAAQLGWPAVEESVLAGLAEGVLSGGRDRVRFVSGAAREALVARARDAGWLPALAAAWLAVTDDPELRAGYALTAGRRPEALAALAAGLDRVEANEDHAAAWRLHPLVSAALEGLDRSSAGARLATRIAFLLGYGGRLAEGLTWLTRAEALAETDADRFEIAVVAAHLERLSGRSDAAAEAGRRALALATDPEARARAAVALANVLISKGQADEAERCLLSAVGLPDGSTARAVRSLLVQVAWLRGDLDRVQRDAEALLDGSSTARRSQLLVLLGAAAHLRGDLDAAEAAYREARDGFVRVGSRGAASAEVNLAVVRSEQGRSEEARAVLEAHLRRARALQQGIVVGVYLSFLLPCYAALADDAAFDAAAAELAERLGHAEPGMARQAERAATIADARGDAVRAGRARSVAAAVWRRLGRDDDAARLEPAR